MVLAGAIGRFCQIYYQAEALRRVEERVELEAKEIKAELDFWLESHPEKKLPK